MNEDNQNTGLLKPISKNIEPPKQSVPESSCHKDENRSSSRSSSSGERCTRKRRYPENGRTRNENNRSKRQCNLTAEDVKKTAAEINDPKKNKIEPEDRLEKAGGKLQFERDLKRLGNLKKIGTSAFSWELTHKFVENHALEKHFEGIKYQPHPIYGVHIAPFTVANLEIPAEPQYLIATTGGKWIYVYTCTETSKLKLIQVYTDPGDDMYYNVKFTKYDDTIFLVSAGKNGTVRVINVAKREVDQSFEGAANAINDIQIHPKIPEIIALASQDMSTHLWNLKSQMQIAIFSGRGLEGHNDQVLTNDFNEDATKMLSSGMDHNVIIWDLVGPNGVEKEIEMSYDSSIKNENRPRLPVWRHFVYLKCSSIHRNYVDCAKFYGETIISKSCHSDGKLCAWMPTKIANDVAPVKSQVDLLFQYKFSSDKMVWFMKFCFDPTKRFLSIGHIDGRVMIVDLHSSYDPTDLRVCYMQGKSDRQTYIRETCFSPDGKFLISVDESAKVFKYNIKKADPSPIQW